MLRSFALHAGTALLFALLMALLYRGRKRETGAGGNPALKYLAAPCLMLGGSSLPGRCSATEDV